MKTLLESLYRKLPIVQMAYRPCRAAYARWRLKQRVRQALSGNGPLRLVIGAKNKYQPGWIPTEVYTLNLLDVKDWQRCFPDESIDMLLAEHVWEHLYPEQGLEAARMCFRFLKPGGHLRVAVPDGFFPDPAYINFVKPGGTGPSADDHKVLYNYRTFSVVFKEAGFRVELLEYFDEAGQFHECDWTPDDGKVVRSTRFYNGRQFGGIKYRSLILDAVKAPH